MSQNISAYDYDTLVHEDRVHRLLYTDPAIFREEMTRIFGAVWVYLGHESEIPAPDDFKRTKLGTRPIVLVRDSGGTVRALFNRCTHRGSTICRQDRGSARQFTCGYHGWSFENSGRLKGVPWASGYASGFDDAKFNLAQVPRVESYRGFVFGTLNPEAPPLIDYLGPVAGPIDAWLDRHPGGRIAVCEANRLKFKGNWKLLYDNSADGYHVLFSHRSLLAMENRLSGGGDKGMAFYRGSPDDAAMYVRCYPNGHHYKDKRPNIENRPGALWEIEGPHPGMERIAASLRQRLGDKADYALDLASSEPVNINIFPNLHILGNHIQVSHPVAVDETDTTWYGTAVIDDGDVLEGAVEEVNALRMRTQESFPNFGEVDDLANFEQIQLGLAAEEDEWVYMHRGLGIPGRIDCGVDGVITGPSTDEVFMREHSKVWKRLMSTVPRLEVKRKP